MLSPDIVIRPADLNDAADLSIFSIESFYDTYEAYNTAEDMQQYVNESFAVDVLEQEINAPNIFYFIAFFNNEIVGYFKLSDQSHPTEIAGMNPIELARIYVSIQHKRKGLGNLFLDKACKFAKQKGYNLLWLGVWEKNEKAIAFYKNYGFTKFGKQEFVLGKDIQTDWQLKLTLD